MTDYDTIIAKVAEFHSYYPEVKSQMDSKRQNINELNKKSEELQRELNSVKLSIDGRKQQIQALGARIAGLQDEYTELINKSYTANEEEIQQIQTRIQQVRQEGARLKGQQNQYQSEIGQLNVKQQHALQQKQQFDEKLRSAQKELKEFSGKCRQCGHCLNTWANILVEIAHGKLEAGNAFGGGNYRFGASTASKASTQLRSKSEKILTESKACRQLAKQYEQLSDNSSGGSLHDERSIER